MLLSYCGSTQVSCTGHLKYASMRQQTQKRVREESDTEDAQEIEEKKLRFLIVDSGASQHLCVYVRTCIVLFSAQLTQP